MPSFCAHNLMSSFCADDVTPSFRADHPSCRAAPCSRADQKLPKDDVLCFRPQIDGRGLQLSIAALCQTASRF